MSIPEHLHKLEVRTASRTQLVNITAQVQELVKVAGAVSGICYLYVPHTTAGIIINEGDDPDVARDIAAALDRMVPRDAPYQHAEGNADAHIKAALVGSSQSALIEHGRLHLGRWQAVFFCEFDGPRQREVHIKIVGD